jgi:DNA-binding transcriptional ArsR family regulator
MVDDFSQRYSELLQGSYDCVDRIILNAFYSVAHSAGGFREWWRLLHNGSEADLDNTHLMRMAGRFSRRVHGFARAQGIPIIDCRRGERKHRIAEQYLATHAVKRGLFLILVGRAVATVWDVQRSANGLVQNIEKKRPYINHYSFHILDPEWGHITIKMAGHPPFAAQIILNGHEYVACQARKRHLTFTKEGNCFTHLTEPARLARIADTLADADTIGQLIQVCERWIYSACLCFALDVEEQERTHFRYAYSVYQVEYSRNLLFAIGGQMEQVFERMVDRTRARLDVARVRTMFGAKQRPRQTRRHPTEPRLAVVVETLEYGLTVFKVHFGNLTLKAYTKGERVLRFEAVVHNTRDLGCGRMIERFPYIVARLEAMLERFMTTLDCVDVAFISDDTLDQLPLPSHVGKTRLGGVDMNKARTRTALAAVLALASSPDGFTVAELSAKAQAMTGQTPPSDYTVRQVAYDLKKLRGKGLVTKLGRSRRYQVHPHGMRAIAALFILRQQVIAPILAGVRSPRLGRKPATWTSADRHYEQLRIGIQPLFHELGIAAA